MSNHVTKEEAVITSKQFRKDADELLQRMKKHGKILVDQIGRFNDRDGEEFEDAREAVAQHVISTRDLESCIMRQGMVLKAIGTPNPYPNSKDTTNTIVDPTADNLKL